jgi:Fic family protein
MSDRIFISSVHKELTEEGRAIRDFVRGDALLRRFFVVSKPTATRDLEELGALGVLAKAGSTTDE